jgi:large subunit ribosomal protein L24
VPSRIRKDDVVKVISGKDKGKTGRVLRVEPRRDRVFVEGLNIQKRHTRPRTIRDAQKGGQVGGVVEKEGPIHISNVMPLDPGNGEATRVSHTIEEDGRRVRVGKRSGTAFE